MSEQQPAASLRERLITMADRLDHDPDHAPDELFTNRLRIELARELTGGEPQVLLDITPPVTRPITRSEYAARLREIGGVR